MISILLTAWKEEKTIGKAIECLCKKEYSGIPDDFELLLVAPDAETENAAMEKVKELGIESKYKYIKDKSEGKPRALNMLFEIARGDTLILTDGEVFLEPNAVGELIRVLNSDSTLGGVSGRPVAINGRKDSIFGYWAHMQADAVHRMRVDRNKKEIKFFPLSGYIMAVKNLKYHFPDDLFLDDAYLSYSIYNSGFQIGYAEAAKVMVKYPTSWDDFIKQKFRSLIGFEQLYKYNIVRPETKSRSFWQEIEYFWFPISYAKNPIELFWSILYYPVRLYLWVRNRLGRDLVRNAKSIRDVYVRTETTK
jgi:cellulose synthase/poly-beta-1,6-N-acetylglucosamine synthase-like glycosyltransferase